MSGGERGWILDGGLGSLELGAWSLELGFWIGDGGGDSLGVFFVTEGLLRD